jgi:DNA polymerase III alpha subunit
MCPRPLSLLAGFSESDADKLRKVIAKKAGGEKLKVYRQQFFDGCSANNVSEETTRIIWEMMLSFDGYSFCKPHSASYAMVSFQSAYLRVHHPSHFMAAVLSNQGGYYRSQAYISEARRMGIHVEGPDINHSRILYHAQGNTLFIGLMAVANLTWQAREQILEERKKRGPFTDLKDASSRLSLCREDWVSLVESGCCDSLGPQYRRSEQLRILLTNAVRNTSSDQLELFSPEKHIPVQTRALVQVKRTEDELHREFSALGFLRTSHPLLLWSQYLKGLKRVKASELGRHRGRYVNLIGYQITQKQVMTKGGQSMSFVSFEDETALYETVLFPDLYQRFYPLLSTLWPLVVFGLVQDDQGPWWWRCNTLGKLVPKRNFLLDSCKIALHIEYSFQSLVVHIADVAEDRPLGPRPVMLAEAPGNPGITVGVAPVHLIGVVQRQGTVECFLRSGAPFKDFLSPVHAQVVVHGSQLGQLPLCCIPIRVMGLSLLQLGKRIQHRPSVLLVKREALPSPGRQSFKGVV